MRLLTPVSNNERESFMDVLRGFAILGIFIANITGFSWYFADSGNTGPYLLPQWDPKMSFLHHMLVEGKFYSIFSLLFGWGIALQFKRANEKGMNALPIIKRRLCFMLLFGGIHLLLWPGDIVFLYAMLGFMLLPFRKLSNKALLITGTLFFLSPILIYAAKSYWQWLNWPVDFMGATAAKLDKKILHTSLSSEKEVAAYLKNASWWDALKANVSGAFYRYGYLFFVSRFPKVLGVFLIGYALGRSNFYNYVSTHKKILYYIIVVGLLVGLPANYMLAHYMSNNMGDYWQLKTKGLYQTIAYALGVVPLAMVYVAVFVLAYQTTVGKKILNPLAPVGKMAFSNYIFQTVVGSVVFLGAGLGYIGQVGTVYGTLFAFLVFIVQIIISNFWLRYFNYGPVEYLWRSATYKKWQVMRKR